MKSLILVIFAILSVTYAAVCGTAALRNGTATATSVNGASASATVLFTSSDSDGALSIALSGSSPYRISTSSEGSAYIAVKGYLNTTCNMFVGGYQAGGALLELWRVDGTARLVNSASTFSAPSAITAVYFSTDIPASGGTYELRVSGSNGLGVTCVSKVLNASVRVLLGVC